MSDILGCPFCGGKAERPRPNDPHGGMVQCVSCGASAFGPKWNRRAPAHPPVQVPVKWESPEEWEIEQRSFHAAGRDDVPIDVQQLVAKLWSMYCHAALPDVKGETEGWRLVPIEPTREMWAAMADSLYGYKNRHHDKVAGDLYRAMLAAAPLPASPEQGGEGQ